MNVTNRPYVLVTEFYGIDGNCVTLANAVKGRLPLNISNWATILGRTSEALSHIHSKGFILGDIKSDNIVVRGESASYTPVQGWVDYKLFVVRYNYSYFNNM